MTLPRLVLVALLVVIGVFGGITPASAHATLESSSPEQGASLSTPPREAKLTFNEAVTLPANPISVSGPDGAAWEVGPVTVAGQTVTAPVTPTGPAGACALTYKVVADDGDQVTGTIRFTMTVAASPPSGPAATSPPPAALPAATPESAPAPPASGGTPAWVWVLLAAIVIVAALAALAARSRRRT